MERASYVDQVEASLRDPRNLVNRLAGPNEHASVPEHVKKVEPEVVHERMHKGRPEGAKNLTTSMRVLVGVMAHYDSRKNVANEFNLPENQVTWAKNGKVGDGHGGHVVPELKEKVQDGVGKARETAVDRLVATLEALTADRIEKVVSKTPEKATSMARDLATVVEKVTPKAVEGANVHVHVYAPREREESEYQTIQIPEVPTMK